MKKREWLAKPLFTSPPPLLTRKTWQKEWTDARASAKKLDRAYEALEKKIKKKRKELEQLVKEQRRIHEIECDVAEGLQYLEEEKIRHCF